MGGNTPPSPERNTAWNKGRKSFHCLGAPNNLIRPWCHRAMAQNAGFCFTLQPLRQGTSVECCQYRSTTYTSMLCGQNAEINVQPGGAYNNHRAWKVNQPPYVAVSNVPRPHRLIRFWLHVYVTVLEAWERRGESAPGTERMWPLLLCTHTVCLSVSQDSHNPDINQLIQSNFPSSQKQQAKD